MEAKSVREAKPRLERIETDILNNFKVLGVKAYPLNGVERLQIMYETFHQEEQQKFLHPADTVTPHFQIRNGTLHGQPLFLLVLFGFTKELLEEAARLRFLLRLDVYKSQHQY